jgi:2-methylcitrate dehydratase
LIAKSHDISYNFGMKTIADRMAGYACSLRYEDLPKMVVHEVKRRVIDSLGCALGGYSARPSLIAMKIAGAVTCPSRPVPARPAGRRQAGGRREGLPGASVLGTSIKTSPDMAAFANGTMVRYLDFNDTYLSKEPAHPSDNIPAALAVAEVQHATGPELITAIVIGYEIQCRLCDAASLRARGWDHVTYGIFSTTLVAARLLKLTSEQAIHALGLAGVANIALRQTRVGELSMWKASAFANTARNGIFAALLAKEGMSGPSPIFEGERAFWRLVSGPFELGPLAGRNGAFFKILDTYIKYYPAEYHAQSAIDAALNLRPRAPLQQIESIRVRTFDAAVEIIASGPEKWRPKTRETADHSLPYCVAVALIDGEVGLAQFSERRIADPRLYQLMEKIQVVADARLDNQYPAAIPNLIEITLKNGTVQAKQVDYPKGHPKNAMTDTEVEEKFSKLCGGLLTKRKIRQVLDRLWEMEKMKDASEVLSLFSGIKGRSK